jgi:hypothetical protein
MQTSAVLVLGEAGAPHEALVQKLSDRGVRAAAVKPASDQEATEALLAEPWTTVAVVTRDDVRALRLTLLSAHVRPDVALWTTLFDHTLVHQLHATVPAVEIISPAELVAAELAEHCLAVAGRGQPRRLGGVRLVDDALRLMTAAGLGLLATLLVQVIISIIALHENAVNALFLSVRTLATISDAPRVLSSPTWFKLVSTVASLLAVGLVAVFTAALVRRLSQMRLTTLFGPRAAPARGHVVIVGFGQVGFRLAQALVSHGLRVVAVERSAEAPCVRLAAKAGIPVTIRRGDDRATLERVGVHECAAVAAVTSDDLMNVAVGLAATDLAPGTPLVLRLGDGQVATETDSLLHLGAICDAHEVVAGHLAAVLTGRSPTAETAERAD